MKYGITLICTTLLATAGLSHASPNDSGDGGFTPVQSISDPQLLLVFLISWLETDLADAHRVYPTFGDLKSISYGEGFRSVIGENKIVLTRSGRVVARETKTRQYARNDEQRHNVALRKEYRYDDESKAFESRVYCNGSFYERHICKFEELGIKMTRYSYNPDGSLHKRPTGTYEYEPLTGTFRRSTRYLFHDAVCDPTWWTSPSDQPDETIFKFDKSGFVTQIISGGDESDPLYNHWYFTLDQNGHLKDTILAPDTPLFRDKIVSFDDFGNPIEVHTYSAVTKFGTIDFEYYGDQVYRREYFKN